MIKCIMVTFALVFCLLAVNTQAAQQDAAASTGSSNTVKAPNPKHFVIPPEKANPVTVPKFDKPPVIDGKLDDEVWKTAIVLKDFYQVQPGDNIAPSKPAEVLLGYDSKTWYIAFRCPDEPGKVRATIAKRDNIWEDDNVGMFIDTFNDKRKAYALFFNPFGIQADGTLGMLINDPDLYLRLERAAANVEEITRRVMPIVDDARIAVDKVARDPGGAVPGHSRPRRSLNEAGCRRAG